MFSECSALKVLDISNFNLNNITSNKNLFKKVEALRYINIYHVEDNNKIIQNSNISSIGNLIVCEKEEMNIIETKNKRCCYFNITADECVPDNYIIIYYGKESEYKNGFINKYRNDVSFIINGDYLNVLETNKEFKVNTGCKIELYFNSTMTSLESFLDYNHDKNIGNIKSIDFSHFKSSLITDMSKTFSGCNLLESIDFYNFNSTSLKNMNSMFFLCDYLKSIDLSFFDVSKVTDMSYMFYGCTS
jgi:surface protein